MELFNTEDFLTREHAGAWTPFLKYCYILSNGMIAIAYIFIPIILIFVWKKRKDIQFSWILICFSLFLLSGAVTHVMNIIVFWWAPYRFYVLLTFINGLLALFTSIVLPLIVKKKLRLLSRQEYHNILDELQSQLFQKELLIQQRNDLITDLKIQIQILERIKERGVWFHDQEVILEDLRKLLKNDD